VRSEKGGHSENRKGKFRGHKIGKGKGYGRKLGSQFDLKLESLELHRVRTTKHDEQNCCDDCSF
jgi:hypothetical protein